MISSAEMLGGEGSGAFAAPSPTVADRRRAYVTALGVRIALASAFTAVMLIFGATGAMPWWNSIANAAILACLALVNCLYWLVGKRRGFPIEDFPIHEAIDVVVLTLVIHFAGGLQAPYCALAYLSLVLFAAVAESRRIALGLASFSIVSLVTLVALEEFQVIPSYAEIWGYRLTRSAQVFALIMSGVFLMSVAWVAGTLANELKESNVRLKEARDTLEEQNRDLERRVEERTAKLARATQEIEDLVHIVSHDLKNVAVAVTETARKLTTREGAGLSERGALYAKNLLEDGRTMSRMLEDLLLLFRHTEGAGTRREWVDVEAVVRQAVRQMQYLIEAKNIEVIIGPLPSVFAETQKIRHVFDNLINNACKYVGDKKPARIEIGGSAQDSMVTFFVRDNGIGLDERQQARVFQLYHRSPMQNVAGVQQDGHGVGLAIVRRIVERYGGVINVRSARGEGTVFEVTLPREDGAVA